MRYVPMLLLLAACAVRGGTSAGTGASAEPNAGASSGARAAPSASPGPGAAAWPDTFMARVEALALLRTLQAELLSQDSATATLEHWCAVHRLAVPARIVAVRDSGVDKPLSAEQRADLLMTPATRVRYRRVKLLCGTTVLSEADNWYVPERLTAEMNRTLDATDTPFGKVVRPLNFRRHTLSSTLLWLPLPAGWEMGRGAPDGHAAMLNIPAAVLENRAVLSVPDGTPFSEVVETYTGNVLSFPAPTP